MTSSSVGKTEHPKSVESNFATVIDFLNHTPKPKNLAAVQEQISSFIQHKLKVKYQLFNKQIYR